MGRMQRTKGQWGEREAAAQICEHTGWQVRRRVRNEWTVQGSIAAWAAVAREIHSAAGLRP